MKKTLLSTASLFTCLLTFAQPWTTGTGNINNTNAGLVKIQRNSPYAGSQLLVVDPLGAGAITLGAANTGSGGTTSLTFSISAGSGGYSSIQSMKSAGSSYGLLALNPTAGTVSIGTTNVAALSSFKLVVDGKIGAKELKITNAGWADYVFSAKHRLMSLSELEQFILANSHLPNIPSQKEIENDGGFNVGEMNVKLLEKIEELTLYVIELGKQNKQLQEQIDVLKRKN